MLKRHRLRPFKRMRTSAVNANARRRFKTRSQVLYRRFSVATVKKIILRTKRILHWKSLQTVRMTMFMQRAGNQTFVQTNSITTEIGFKDVDGYSRCVMEWKNGYFLHWPTETQSQPEDLHRLFEDIIAARMPPSVSRQWFRLHARQRSVTPRQSNSRFSSRQHAQFQQLTRMDIAFARFEFAKLFCSGHITRACLRRKAWTICKPQRSSKCYQRQMAWRGWSDSEKSYFAVKKNVYQQWISYSAHFLLISWLMITVTL